MARARADDDAAPGGPGRRARRAGRRERPRPHQGRPRDRRGAAARHRAARRAARPQHRCPLPPRRRRGDVGPPPRQRHLPRRRHRLAQARRLPPHRGRLRRARRRLAQRHLRQPRARRRGHAHAPATRCRSASSGSSSTRARPDPSRVRRGRRRPPHRGCGGAGPDRGVPRRHHLQGALPRGRGAGHAHPHRLRATGSSRPDDVERLRYVLRAQRDLFWPLKVIKDNLEAIDRGLTPGDAGDGRPQPPAPVPDPDVPDAADLAAAPRRCGSPPPSWPGPAGWRRPRSPTSRRTACCAPTPPGCTTRPTCRSRTPPPAWAAYGVEPRHLRGFRAAADREVGLVEQVVGPRRGADAAAARRRGGPPVPGPARRAGPWRAVRPWGLTDAQVRGVR